ncbi:DoxX family protein [Streptomyces sp. NPDC058067]|uniref:DoxX family protein n=1 Tax=Streptomyces sp. NPDC058067 TaxID=3346324 RepID=UPI0036DFFBE6
MSETTASVSAAASASATRAPAAGRARAGRVALRTLTVLLALFFGVASATPKLIAHPSAVEAFDTIGWGSAAMYIIGALELAGGIALLVPVLSGIAPVALGALMVGAFVVQMTSFDGENAATPLILIVPLALLAWTRRDRNADLVRLVTRRG